MKKLILIITILSILTSCSNENSESSVEKTTIEQYQTKIDSLENARASYFKSTGIPPKELVLQSVQTYEFFAADYPDNEKTGGYLFEAAKRYEIDLQDYENAVKLYKEVYDNHEEYEHHKMALFHIGNAYHSLNDTTNAIANFKLFIQKYPKHDFADDAQGMIDFSRLGEEEFFKRILEKTKKDSVN